MTLQELQQQALKLSPSDRQQLLHTIQDSLNPPPPPQTLDLRNQPFIGIWRDRAETQDSTTWVSTLRRTHWQTPQSDNIEP